MRKHWGKFVRTWFDQPAKANKRASLRRIKAKVAFPRPAQPLRPIVNCQTRKYNSKLRFGRGFTSGELKAAGLTPNFARTIGVTYDHRRTNANEDAFKRNVDRLKEYKSKLVLFPLKKDKFKKGEIADSTAEQIAKANADLNFNLSKNVLEIPKTKLKEKKIEITEEFRKKNRAVQGFRQAQVNQKFARKRFRQQKQHEQNLKDTKEGKEVIKRKDKKKKKGQQTTTED